MSGYGLRHQVTFPSGFFEVPDLSMELVRAARKACHEGRLRANLWYRGFPEKKRTSLDAKSGQSGTDRPHEPSLRSPNEAVPQSEGSETLAGGTHHG